MNRPRGFAELLATLDPPAAVRAELIRRAAEPWRGYHGLNHLAVLWRRHRRFARNGPLANRRMMRLIAATILLHDSVLVPGATDNEQRSAALWQRLAPRLRGFTPVEIGWVTGTILATADHLATPLGRHGLDRARSWLLDLDLTPIGEEPTGFSRNGRGLRAEERQIDDATYDAAVIRFLARLGAAPAILRTPRLSKAFEAQARRNIAAEIERAAMRRAARGAAGGT